MNWFELLTSCLLHHRTITLGCWNWHFLDPRLKFDWFGFNNITPYLQMWNTFSCLVISYPVKTGRQTYPRWYVFYSYTNVATTTCLLHVRLNFLCNLFSQHLPVLPCSFNFLSVWIPALVNRRERTLKNHLECFL